MGSRYVEKNEREEKRRLPPYIYLAYLLVCTAVLTGVSLAGYTTTVSGSDSARIAAFVVTASSTQDGNALVIDCADTSKLTQEYQFTVANNQDGKVSEVAANYDVVVTLNQALPTGVSMTLDGNSGSASGNTYTFSNAGTFTAAAEEEIIHTLTFTADADTAAATSAPINITVSVHAEQAD